MRSPTHRRCALARAVAPRQERPRWKSERCPIRMPSSRREGPGSAPRDSPPEPARLDPAIGAGDERPRTPRRSRPPSRHPRDAGSPSKVNHGDGAAGIGGRVSPWLMAARGGRCAVRGASRAHARQRRVGTVLDLDRERPARSSQRSPRARGRGGVALVGRERGRRRALAAHSRRSRCSASRRRTRRPAHPSSAR